MIKIRKFIYIILIVSLFCTFAACGQKQAPQYSPDQIAQVIIAAQDSAPAMRPLLPGNDDYSAYLIDIYEIDADNVPDGAVYYAGGIEASEIAVFVHKDNQAANDTESALNEYLARRAGVFTGYAPAQAEMVKQSVVAKHRLYVALLICEDPSNAKKTFEACFGANPPDLPSAPVSATADATASDSSANAIAAGETSANAIAADETTSGSAASSALADITQPQTTEAPTAYAPVTEAQTAYAPVTEAQTAYAPATEPHAEQTPTETSPEQAQTEKAPATHTEAPPETASALSQTTSINTSGDASDEAAPALTSATSPAPQATTAQSDAETSPSNQNAPPPPETQTTASNDVLSGLGAETTASPGMPGDGYDLSKDKYSRRAVIRAWKSGDSTALTYKNRMIYDACADVIGKVIKNGMTDYAKELAIHDWIVEWANYDEEAASNAPDAQPDPDNDNPYGLLINHKAICKGFTYTFQLFMDMLNIECITVEGNAWRGTEPHAWNMVLLDDDWYCVDVTWDDPISSSNVDIYMHHKYFNVTSEFLRQHDHQWDESTAPEATSTAYSWVKSSGG